MPTRLLRGLFSPHAKVRPSTEEIKKKEKEVINHAWGRRGSSVCIVLVGKPIIIGWKTWSNVEYLQPEGQITAHIVYKEVTIRPSTIQKYFIICLYGEDHALCKGSMHIYHIGIYLLAVLGRRIDRTPWEHTS